MPAAGAGDFITVASTTSTQNAGLFDRLLPLFEAETGIEVRVVAVGTGQALRLARNGDADLLLVHDKPSEEAFVAEGYGSARFDLMYNDFVVVGPASDPAGIAGTDEAAAALANVAAAEAPFVSPRRRQRHPPARARALGGRRVGPHGRVGHLVPRGRPGHGGGAQHRLDDGGLYARRSRHLAEDAGQARPCASWSRAMRGSATSMASPS